MKARVLAAALLLFAAALVWSGNRAGMYLLCASALLLALADWRSLLEFGSPRFWLPLFAFVLLVPFFIGAGDWRVLGRAYSPEQFYSGLRLLCNAYIFTVLAAYVSRNFSLHEIVAFSERCGGRNMGLRVALVTASAGMVKRALSETWLLYSAGRRGRRLVAELPVFMSAALRNTALRAEQIAVLFFIRDIGV